MLLSSSLGRDSFSLIGSQQQKLQKYGVRGKNVNYSMSVIEHFGILLACTNVKQM